MFLLKWKSRVGLAIATLVTLSLTPFISSQAEETTSSKVDCIDQKISMIGLQGFSVTLKDGTVWTTPGSAAGNVFYWQPEDPVKVCGNKITNLSTQQAVKFTPVKRTEKHRHSDTAE
ncbi:MAG: hypothetical protein K2X01_01650 [Cyanobacteria bacterium]|nr:hypothetical protein [Cyanobacteriota bacterium]